MRKQTFASMLNEGDIFWRGAFDRSACVVTDRQNGRVFYRENGSVVTKPMSRYSAVYLQGYTSDEPGIFDLEEAYESIASYADKV